MNTALSETERVQNQSIEEWLDEYNGGISSVNNKVLVSPVNNLLANDKNRQSSFQKVTMEIGIVSVKLVGKELLVTTNTHITKELDIKIKKNIQQLAKIAEQDAGETLYKYIGYRTLYSEKRPFIAVVFRDIRTGETTERFFNIILRNKEGKNFKTKSKGEFRVVGTTERLTEGMFLKFWMCSTKLIPDGKLSHIYRYMKPWLSDAVVSCPNPDIDHEITRLKKLVYEGHLYQIT